MKSISLSLCLVAVFLTFRDEVLVELTEASFTSVFLKQQLFSLVVVSGGYCNWGVLEITRS